MTKVQLAIAATHQGTVMKIGDYKFTYDKNLKPIPVEVPSTIAQILLQMTQPLDKCCKHKSPKPMFTEAE